MSGNESSKALEREVSKTLNELRETLDLEKLQEALEKLPTMKMYSSAQDIPSNDHECTEQELLDALFGVFERFPSHEDFGLWSIVTSHIKLTDFRSLFWLA